MTTPPLCLRVTALLLLGLSVGCGSIDRGPTDGPTVILDDGATGGAGAAANDSATGGAGAAANDGATGGTAPGSGYQVGTCQFPDQALAAAVTQSMIGQGVSNVLDLTSLHTGADVLSLAGVGCLTNVVEASLFSDGAHTLDLAPLGELTSLRFLHLIGGKHTSIEVLAALPLTHLQLAGLDWTTLAPLAGAATVQVMWIQEMPATDLSALATFTNLVSLGLEKTSSFDVSPLGELDALAELHLYETLVTDLDGLGSIAHLDSLSVSATPLQSLTGLAGAPELARITIDSVPQLTSLDGLEDLPRLAHLTITFSALSDLSAIAGSSSLTSVTVDDADLADIAPLGTCEQLTELSVRGNHITDLEPLVDLPLRGLDVSHNPILSLAPIAMLEGLERLGMAAVGADSLDFLAGLDLFSLIANDNQLAEVSVTLGMPLSTLDLRNNQIVSLPAGFVGAQGPCSHTWLEENPLDADADALLQSLCSTVDVESFSWDGGDCVNCFILK